MDTRQYLRNLYWLKSCIIYPAIIRFDCLIEQLLLAQMSDRLLSTILSQYIIRLLSVYAGEADKLKRLTEIVLGHHNKDSNTWSLQV